jgi:hypothetical protein
VITSNARNATKLWISYGSPHKKPQKNAQPNINCVLQYLLKKFTKNWQTWRSKPKSYITASKLY